MRKLCVSQFKKNSFVPTTQLDYIARQQGVQIMKTKLNLLIFIALALSSINSASASENMTDITTGVLMDGFCVADTMALASSTDTVSFESSKIKKDAKTFLYKVGARSIKLYRNYFASNGLSPEEQDKLRISSRVVYKEKYAGSGTYKKVIAGAVVSVDGIIGDEDQLTFFYQMTRDEKTKLRLVIHNEQSSVAYWHCD
jgi:ribosomal protein L35AE/L33A